MTALLAAPNSAQTAQPSPPSATKTFAEFFAGIGLVEEGLRGSGWRCVYANDIDPRKHQLHQDRNGDVAAYHLGDVREAEAVAGRIPDAPFLATASFPCVDLSTAGHYRGFEGAHSSTFFAFVDVLRALGERRPKVVMIENVVGFLTARGGADFATAATTLADLGYWIDAFVVDARHFLPQSRPRVFVVAKAEGLHTVGRSRDLFGSVDVDESPQRPAGIVRFMRSLPLATGWAPAELPPLPVRAVDLADVVDVDEGQEWWPEAQVERHLQMMSELHRRRIDALAAAGEPFVGTIFRRVRKDGQRAEVRFDGLAGCLRTPRGGSGRQIVVAVQGGHVRMRWMSPREYGRLQGAPDFPLLRKPNQLLMGFADAVCVPAIAWIDRHVLTPLHDAHHAR